MTSTASDQAASTTAPASVKPPVRSATLDRIQLGLIAGFTLCFFVTAVASRNGWIAYGSLATLTFLGLAASITLYYFLNSVAEVKEKNYSIAGAGAIFVIVFGLGLSVIRTDADASLQTLNTQLKALEDQLALSGRDIEISGHVKNPRDGTTIDGVERNLQVGILLEGEFFSEQGEHIFVVPELPRDSRYKILVGDPSTRVYYVTPIILNDAASAPPGSTFTKEAIFPDRGPGR